jgi:hypothetical protein
MPRRLPLYHHIVVATKLFQLKLSIFANIQGCQQIIGAIKSLQINIITYIQCSQLIVAAEKSYQIFVITYIQPF